MSRPTLTPEAILARRVAPASDDVCWPWLGPINNKGYGYVRRTSAGVLRVVMAHRFVYEVLVGPIPEGLQLDHLCRNRPCVNPAHLEPVTNAENARRAAAILTHCKNGHEFTPENTLARPNGWRGCRECGRIAFRRYWHSEAAVARRRQAAA